MMKLKSIQGAGLVEYVVLIVIILSSLYVMKDMFSRGVFAKYRQTGEAMSFGRQFDAKRTIVCRQDVLSYNVDGSANMGSFYNEDCYYARVMRKPIISNGVWDAMNGGCPKCEAENSADAQACLNCQQAIKNQCAVESAYCSR